MNFRLLFIGLFVFSFIVGYTHHGYATEEYNRGADKVKIQPKAKGELKTIEVANKICPVSGEKVGEMGEIVKYEYKGKIYNLCCEACLKDFKKDPEKYSTIADEEIKEIQTDPHKDHNHNNS